MPRAKKQTTLELKESKEVKETKEVKVVSVSSKVESVNKEVSTPTSKTSSIKKNAATKAYPKVKEEEPKPNTISRLELSQEVAKVVGRMMEITGRDAETIVTEIFSSMIDALQSGEKIEIRGFGSFRLRNRRARNGRNPKTGESVKVPGKTVVYFKMGAELKEFLKKK